MRRAQLISKELFLNYGDLIDNESREGGRNKQRNNISEEALIISNYLKRKSAECASGREQIIEYTAEKQEEVHLVKRDWEGGCLTVIEAAHLKWTVLNHEKYASVAE